MSINKCLTREEVKAILKGQGYFHEGISRKERRNFAFSSKQNLTEQKVPLFNEMKDVIGIKSIFHVKKTNTPYQYLGVKFSNLAKRHYEIQNL